MKATRLPNMPLILLFGTVLLLAAPTASSPQSRPLTARSRATNFKTGHTALSPRRLGLPRSYTGMTNLPAKRDAAVPAMSRRASSSRGISNVLRVFSAETDTETATSNVKTGAGQKVVIPEDYRFGGTLLGVAALLGPVLHLWPQFALHALIGGFLTFQTTRVRFRFSDEDLDVVFIDKEEGATDQISTDSSGENMLQGGGANKWKFRSVINWEMWWPGFPMLVYYKETQTKPEGQVHFFPIIMDGKKLYEQMLSKMGPSKNAKPALDDWNLDTALESTPVGRSLKEQMDEKLKAKLKDIKDLGDVVKAFSS